MSQPLSAVPTRALAGTIRVPGDKSISHRALILGALATGRTRITGLLESEDVLATARAVVALGAQIRHVNGSVEVTGQGVGGLQAPIDDLDFGNSGTGSRLMLGVVAGHDMIKSELIQRVAAANPHLFQRDVERIINIVLDEITGALARGDRVELRGFGAFTVKHRAARQGRNPRTGDTVFVEDKFVPFFKTGKELRERLNREDGAA